MSEDETVRYRQTSVTVYMASGTKRRTRTISVKLVHGMKLKDCILSAMGEMEPGWKPLSWSMALEEAP